MSTIVIPGHAADRLVLRYAASVDRVAIPALVSKILSDRVRVIDAAIAGVRAGHPDAPEAYGRAVQLPPDEGDGITAYEIEADPAILAALRCHSGGSHPVEHIAAGVVRVGVAGITASYAAWVEEMMDAMLVTGI